MLVSIRLIFSSSGSLCDLARFAARSCAALRSTAGGGVSTCALKFASFRFPMVVLYCARVLTNGLADHNVPKPIHSVISLYKHSASDANQQVESKVRERRPHLSDDCSCRVISRLMESCDASKIVDIVIYRRLWQTLMFFVGHL